MSLYYRSNRDLKPSPEMSPEARAVIRNAEMRAREANRARGLASARKQRRKRAQEKRA